VLEVVGWLDVTTTGVGDVATSARYVTTGVWVVAGKVDGVGVSVFFVGIQINLVLLMMMMVMWQWLGEVLQRC